ncbi:MAG: cysteine desulfurase [archaeon]|nr:cysteine desulfurase [archaeon]MCP8314669.1 cysteine desulfurase [archaeon]
MNEVREDFLILKSGLIYLDSAASSLTPEQVIAKMLEYYREYRANTGRSLYRIADRATSELEEARKSVAKLIGARKDEVAFVRNTSEGLNFVASSLKFKKGQNIVTTAIEHHSNFLPWLKVSREKGLKLKIINPKKDFLINVEDFGKQIDDDTRVVAITHISNVLGSITPVKDIVDIAHEHGSLVALDGAQSVPHIPLSVKEIDADFLSFSGHKMCGPTGIGGLYVKSDVLNELEPVFVGGESVDKVSFDDYTLANFPASFESGTLPIAEAIGLGEAANYLMRIGLENITANDRRLIELLYKLLSTIKGLKIYSPSQEKISSIVSFNIGNLDPNDVALFLDVSSNIAVRSGFMCAQPLVKNLLGSKYGVVRASTYLYNIEKEIETLAEKIEGIAKSAY